MIVDRISAQPVRAAGCAHMKGVWHFSYDKSIVVSLQVSANKDWLATLREDCEEDHG